MAGRKTGRRRYPRYLKHGKPNFVVVPKGNIVISFSISPLLSVLPFFFHLFLPILLPSFREMKCIIFAVMSHIYIFFSLISTEPIPFHCSQMILNHNFSLKYSCVLSYFPLMFLQQMTFLELCCPYTCMTPHSLYPHQRKS